MTTAVSLPQAAAVRLTVRGLVAGEWIKVRHARSTLWVLGLVVAMMIAMSVTVALSARTGQLDGAVVDAGMLAAMATGGVQGAQFAAIALGVLVVTGEYRTGLVRAVFNADPRRTRVLVAKAVVVAATCFVSTVASSLAGLVVAHVLVADQVTGAVYTDPTLWRALLGAGLYLAFVAVASLACAAALRRTTPAVTAVLALLWALPGTAVLFEGGWVGDAVRFLPSSAGAALYAAGSLPGDLDVFAAMTPASSGQLAPWLAFLVLAGYLALLWWWGASATRRRDV